MDFSEKVYQEVRKIPKGKVATYGQIAKILGKSKASRAVGQVLRQNPYASLVPCYRVISAKGHLWGFAQGLKEKKRLLQIEGVKVVGNLVDLKKYLWKK